VNGHHSALPYDQPRCAQLLPFLNIGGVSYFSIESSDISERPFERFSTFVLSLLSIYTALTLQAAWNSSQVLYFSGFTHSKKGSVVIIATGVRSSEVYITGIFCCSGVVTMLFSVGVR
jgi:hypothetical protein